MSLLPVKMHICLLQSFFGRTYNNLNSISECKNNGECVINKKNRTSCKACRLRKCLLVGMSKSGSRYGRRSNWFKIHCLLQDQTNNPMPLFPRSHPGYFPSGLIPTHFLTGEKFSAEVKCPSKKRKTDSPSSDESVAEGISSAEEDSSRSNSVLSFLRQAPSPFSDKQDLAWIQQQQNQNRKLSATVTLTLPPSSPPYGRHFPGVSLTSGGIPPSPRDFLLYSPAVGVAAVEQDQPIDLSIRAAEVTVPSRDNRDKDDRGKTSLVNNETDDSVHEDLKHSASAAPLDLTLRPAQVEG